MANLHSIPAGIPFAPAIAKHLLASIPAAELSRAIILVPTRRSCVTIRLALLEALAGKATLLPRILPLADTDAALFSLLGEHAADIAASIPPAIPEAQHRYLLAQQIAAFESRRMGSVSIHYALTLADTLMALQETCTRHNATMNRETLRNLFHANFATHWQQALQFLSILTETWPAIEQELGRITAAAREVALMDALASHWAQHPTQEYIYAIGSTASQPATARLLSAIANLPNGHVVLPGLDTSMGAGEWADIAPGHPLYHLKSFVGEHSVTPLADAPRSLWLDALAPTSRIPEWRTQTAKPKTENLRIIPCAHAEEEARVISLLLREALESPDKRTALITPDESLMSRVASHMQRYGITLDRLSAGSLRDTATGSLWATLLAAIREPERQLTLRSLLHHPLMDIDAELLAGLEKGWHGVNRQRRGQLPRHDPTIHRHIHYQKTESLVHSISELTEAIHSASEWLATCQNLLKNWAKAAGQGAEAVEEQLAMLTYADDFGPLDAEDFAALVDAQLSVKWRDIGLNTEPRIALLTPVEARLEQFDRVILANMQDSIWPGTQPANPWLNLAAQQAIGLPPPEESVSLVAHDILMLASRGEVFLTYPKRDDGAPATRSRFIERLVTLLAAHDIDEHTITASHYATWATAHDTPTEYAPEREIFPRPTAAQRPRKMQVTDIDKLFTDPFSIYAKYVLGLRKLDDIDADPEASDFGSLAHKAIEQLTQHWNHAKRPATAAELDHIANHALRDFSERPNIALFWRTRLLGGLRYVNQLESERRSESIAVAAEQTIEGQLATITLYGRMDRVERRGERTTIIDYKTGDIPSEKKILSGQALQLLAYAMLLGNAEAIEYWALPKLGEEGELRHLDTDTALLEPLQQRLEAALTAMLDEKIAFLATAADEHFTNDYSGISRFDEWAG